MTISKKAVKKPRSKITTKPDRQDAHTVYESSGNVFKDMGKCDEEAGNLIIRSILMLEIEQAIGAMGCTKVHAAKVLGVSAPRINELVSGRIDLFTIDTLIKHLNKLGKQVTVTVKDRAVA